MRIWDTEQVVILVLDRGGSIGHDSMCFQTKNEVL